MKRPFSAPQDYVLYSLISLLFLFNVNGLKSETICNLEQELNLAENYFERGRFYEAIDTLESLRKKKETCLEETKGVSKGRKTYRRQYERLLSLLAKSNIELDLLREADAVIYEILDDNPLFSPASPPKFKQMVEDAKKRRLSFSVSSVSKKVESIYQTPATVIVLDQEKIRRRGYIDLDQMFDDLPGFDVSRTVGATYSNIYQRGYRSIATNRTIFMINGIEDNDFWGNLSYWSRQIPLSNVKRVEIVYGPTSTMYGKNALVGVVNVITKNPVEFIKGDEQLGINFDAGIGSYNTKYGEATITGKMRDKNVYLSLTGRAYFSDEMNLSSFPEYDFNQDFYDTLDYISTLGLPDDSIFGVPAGVAAEMASKLDKALFDEDLGGQPIQYSNLLEQFYIKSLLQVGDLSLGYQYWQSTQGNVNFGHDNSRPGAKNGSVWAPIQSTLYANYETRLSSKLILTNTAQFRISEVSDNSRLISLKNYSNKGIPIDSLYLSDPNREAKLPFWQTELFFQRSKQFRNEFRMIYNPISSLDIIGGFEYRFSTNQGDYQRLILTDSTQGPASEFGKSSLDKRPGGNSLDYREIGLFLQGTYRFIDSKKHSWLGLTLGVRYDSSRIGTSDGFGSVFNPRVSLIFTPPDFLSDKKTNFFYLKGIYASAFLDPSSRDRYSIASATRKVNNPNLAAETVDNLEAVIGYYKKGNPKIGAEASYYIAHYDNVVAQKDVGICQAGNGLYTTDCTVFTDTTGQNTNIGSLRIAGVQAYGWLEYQLPGELINSIYLYANYTYTDPLSVLTAAGGVQVDSFIRVGDIANHHFNFGMNTALFYDVINLNLRGNYVSERPVGESPIRTTVPRNPQPNGVFDSYFLLNGALTIRATRDFMPAFEGLQVQFVANNILNKQYFHPGIRAANGTSIAYRTPQKNRNFLIRLIYDFN